MLVYANSHGSHYVNHKDLNNPKNNKQMNKTFKIQLKKNGNDFADVAVNDNGKYYYCKFDNLQNFFQKLNDNDNSIFQLAKNNNISINKRNFNSSLNNNSLQTSVPHIKLIRRPSSGIISSITHKSHYKKPNARKPNARKPNARKPNARKSNARKSNARKPNARKPNTRKLPFKRGNK